MNLIDDPRNPEKRMTNKSKKGRNTESFNPEDMLVRPSLRIRYEMNTQKYPRSLKHDDVIYCPNFESDPKLFETMVTEIKTLQDSGVKGSEYISWSEGSHTLVKNPEKSETFQRIINHICEYLDIDKKTISVRFNMFVDDKDMKLIHHDSAAFNKERATKQNITAAVSLGRERELVFKHAKNGTLLYMPVSSGSLYTFGRDVNIRFLHGINAIRKEEQTNEPRISIVVWGLARNCIEEEGSPNILEDNDRRSNDRKLNSDMVSKELQNFANGSDKISQFSLLRRIQQCSENKKDLLEFASSVSRFGGNELKKIHDMMQNC